MLITGNVCEKTVLKRKNETETKREVIVTGNKTRPEIGGPR